jgi:hypothetical protein
MVGNLQFTFHQFSQQRATKKKKILKNDAHLFLLDLTNLTINLKLNCRCVYVIYKKKKKNRKKDILNHNVSICKVVFAFPPVWSTV